MQISKPRPEPRRSIVILTDIPSASEAPNRGPDSTRASKYTAPAPPPRAISHDPPLTVPTQIDLGPVVEVVGVGAGSACSGPAGEEGCTWERGNLPGRVRVLRVIPGFLSVRQSELTCSHVRRPPCAHMGVGRPLIVVSRPPFPPPPRAPHGAPPQLILTIPEKPWNLNKTPHPPREIPLLPCATPPAHPPGRFRP